MEATKKEQNNVSSNNVGPQKPASTDKTKSPKKPRRPFKVVMKTWSKGLQKEGSRITWEKKLNVIKDFVVIVAISIILALIFFGIDMIIITIRK